MPAPPAVIAAPEPPVAVGGKEDLPDERVGNQETQGLPAGLGQRLPAQSVVGRIKNTLFVADKEAGRPARRTEQKRRLDPFGQQTLLPMLAAVLAKDKPATTCQADPAGFGQHGLYRPRRPIGLPVGATVRAQTDLLVAGQTDDTLVAGLDDQAFRDEVERPIKQFERGAAIERTIKPAVLKATRQGKQNRRASLTTAGTGAQLDQLQPVQTGPGQTDTTGSPG